MKLLIFLPCGETDPHGQETTRQVAEKLIPLVAPHADNVMTVFHSDTPQGLESAATLYDVLGPKYCSIRQAPELQSDRSNAARVFNLVTTHAKESAVVICVTDTGGVRDFPNGCAAKMQWQQKDRPDRTELKNNQFLVMDLDQQSARILT